MIERNVTCHKAPSEGQEASVLVQCTQNVKYGACKKTVKMAGNVILQSIYLSSFQRL